MLALGYQLLRENVNIIIFFSTSAHLGLSALSVSSGLSISSFLSASSGLSASS
jgi:hypothetical protein